MKNILNWLLKSSADANKTSLTVKGVLASLVPLLVLTGLDEGSVNTLVEAIVQTIAQFGVVVTAGVTLYGFLRKIALTVGKLFKK